MRFINIPYQTNGALRNNHFYKMEGPITEEDVVKINQLNYDVILVFDNTKDLNPNILRKITNPHVTFSILGGLDYYRKKKFDSTHYIERTLYKPMELASVIEVLESIERKIRYTWTDRQKVMFVYKTLCESLHYSRDDEGDYEDGHDVVRSLRGLLYGRLVCAGFSMVFKEIMDRIGIPCIYQNQQHSHAWNVVTLDGQNYALDLTWDCAHKKDNTCKFRHFGRDPFFYQDRYHDLSQEAEEKEMPISTFTSQELSEDLKHVAYSKLAEKREMTPLSDGEGKIFYNLYQQSNDGVYHYFVFVYGQLVMIHTTKSPEQLQAMDIFDAIQNHGWSPNIPVGKSPFMEYQRDDRSVFMIMKAKDLDSLVSEYYYFDVARGKDGNPIIRRAALLSETRLDRVENPDVRHRIANFLISKQRLSRKILRARGYVGYIGADLGLYYDRDFEKDQLHLIEHA